MHILLRGHVTSCSLIGSCSLDLMLSLTVLTCLIILSLSLRFAGEFKGTMKHAQGTQTFSSHVVHPSATSPG